MGTVLPHHNTDDCAGRKASCGGRMLICQVGLVKNSIGRERDGGDLPWPVSDMKETKKKSLMTFQSGSQPCVDYTSLATKLVLLRNHFSPWSLNRHLYGSWKGFPASFLGRIMTPHVEGMSAFYLTVWDSREGKFNENTSEVMGEMSAFSLITAFFSPE